MLQLVSSSPRVTARLRLYVLKTLSSLNLRLLMIFCLLCAGLAHAQDITMPEVTIDGISDDSNGADILIIILKFLGRIFIWGCMLYAGFVALKTILKSWNEQKMNDQGRWGAVISDSLGSVLMVIFVIAIGTWILKFLN